MVDNEMNMPRNLHKSLYAVLLAGVAGIVLFSAAWALGMMPVEDEVIKQYARSAKMAAAQLPRVHLTRKPFNDNVATNAIHNFITALDFDHSYFLASDIEQFKRNQTELDDQLEEGKFDIAFEIYDVLLERMSNRVDYVKSLFDKEFDFTIDEVYQWDRKKAPWPENKKEWNDLWRKKVKNQYLARLVAEELKEENKAEKPDAKQNTNDVSNVISNDTADASSATNLVVDLSPEESIIKEYQRYYDVIKDNDAHWLISLYITSFARSFDPHSDYMSQQNMEDFQINMKLSLVGIGAMLRAEDGTAKVERIIPGGPADMDGRLQAGDKIIAVAQGDKKAVDILHWPLSKTVRLIRGEKGTKVVLHILPASDPSGSTVKTIDIIRDEVKLEERASKGEIKTAPAPNGTEKRFGIIRVPDFYADVKGKSSGDSDARSVTRDVQRILEGFKTNNIDGVILDLRNNGGGLLEEAIEMTGLFIDTGPVVQVKDYRGVHILSDSDPATVYEGPLMVLVNKQSASASEIVAGALQDYGRAIVVGDSKTHGKGTVQSLINLHRFNPSLGSLKLTTASFYRIAGGSTQKKGIHPDIVVPSILDYMEIGEENLPGALPWTVVTRALYREYEELDDFISVLQQRSNERRLESPRYQTYEELLTYLGEKRKSKQISLQYNKRVERARREQKMTDFMEEHTPNLDTSETTVDSDAEKDGEDDNPPKNDLILEEALHIFTDYLQLEADASRIAKKSSTATAPDDL